MLEEIQPPPPTQETRKFNVRIDKKGDHYQTIYFKTFEDAMNYTKRIGNEKSDVERATMFKAGPADSGEAIIKFDKKRGRLGFEWVMTYENKKYDRDCRQMNQTVIARSDSDEAILY